MRRYCIMHLCKYLYKSNQKVCNNLIFRHESIIDVLFFFSLHLNDKH